MSEEKAPSSGAFLPASPMYFCSGKPMHFRSGIDTPDSNRPGNALIVHTAHTAHATARHTGGPTFLLRPFGDHGFRGDQKPGDRRCILQRRPHNLGWVDDALGDEIDVLAVLGVEAVRVLVLLEDLADDNRPVFARIDGDLSRRPGERLAHDIDAGLLVVVLRAYLLQHFSVAQEC